MTVRKELAAREAEDQRVRVRAFAADYLAKFPVPQPVRTLEEALKGSVR